MHTATGLWMTHHGFKRLRQERTDLRDWLGHLKQRAADYVTNRRQKREIDLILFEGRIVKNRLERVDTILDHAVSLPSVWVHKAEVRVGDTVYLRHNQTIRAFTLVTTGNADPTSGKVSLISPIGQVLVGRHQGDTVRLDTLDGQLKYEVIKII